MEFNYYQKTSRQTALYVREGIPNYIYPTLGLTGEAGEVAEKVKKILRDDNGIINEEKRVQIAKELGDVLWYLSQLSTELGFSLDEIAQQNIDKINERLKQNKIGGSGDNREDVQSTELKGGVKNHDYTRTNWLY